MADGKKGVDILPVPAGVTAVDDWYWFGAMDGNDRIWKIAPEKEIFKCIDKNTMTIPFDKLFKTESKLNTFYLLYKESYTNKVELITHYLNYFVEFYDPDKELLTNYFYTKYILDDPDTKFTREEFITWIYNTFITDSIYDKVKKMVDDNYRIDLRQTNTEKIKYSESLEFTNEHAKTLMLISMLIRMLIPIVLHYIALNKTKKEIHNLAKYYKPIFALIEEKEHTNLYAKMYNSISVKVNVSQTRNKAIWDKYEVEQEDPTTYTEELLDKNIIVDTIFKYVFVKNIIAFNFVIVDTQLDFFVIKNLNVNMREISTEKDSEGLSSLDKLEMNNTKIDESMIVLSKINIKKTIKRIKRQLRINIGEDEIEFYMEHMKINPISKNLVYYFYAKYFGGYRDLNSITLRQYIELMILMKRVLEAREDVYLPQIISANINGKINSRTIHNSKFLTRIQQSSVYKNLVKNKYSTLAGIGKSDIIINLLSVLINTSFTYCDYDVMEDTGKTIEINADYLSQEFLDFINQI